MPSMWHQVLTHCEKRGISGSRHVLPPSFLGGVRAVWRLARQALPGQQHSSAGVSTPELGLQRLSPALRLVPTGGRKTSPPGLIRMFAGLPRSSQRDYGLGHKVFEPDTDISLSQEHDKENIPSFSAPIKCLLAAGPWEQGGGKGGLRVRAEPSARRIFQPPQPQPPPSSLRCSRPPAPATFLASASPGPPSPRSPTHTSRSGRFQPTGASVYL